jgi:hypothetical protein
MRIAVNGLLMGEHLSVHEAAHCFLQHLLFVIEIIEHDLVLHPVWVSGGGIWVAQATGRF